MDAILHEKQEGSLCAQHALNALLQGNYFTAIDLAELARQLDESEKATMAEGGETEEFQRFVQQPSSNFDDSGYFSIQVIQKALSVWGLELIPYQSSDPTAVEARENPVNQSAYICNFKDHWFSVRKLGHQWFNLNSLLTGPELISDTYLSMFLTQLQQEGYSIFMVLGQFPDCEADQLLKLMPAVQRIKPKLLTEVSSQSSTADDGINQEDLQKALEESKRLIEDDDGSLQAALALSLKGIDTSALGSSSTSQSAGATSNPMPSTSQQPDVVPDKAPNPEELRQKRLAYLDRLENKNPSGGTPLENGEKPPSELTEDEMLQAALKMSMESS